MTVSINRTDFLEALFGPYSKGSRYFILVRAVDDYGSRASNRFYPNMLELSNAEFSPDRHVYFGVCPRERMHVGKEHIRYIAALWASLDIGPGGYSGLNHNFVDVTEARETIESFPLKPSIIVQSGRGFHLYWLLHSQKKIPDVEAVENLLRKLNDHFRCPSPVGLESTLRLPGTWNPRGSRTPTKCFVEHLDPTLRYYPTEFQNLDLRPLARDRATSPDIVQQEQLKSTPVARTSKEHLELAHETEEADSQDPVAEVEAYASSKPRFLRKVIESESNQPGGRNDTALLAGLTDKALEELADKVADRLTQRVSENLSNAMVDRIIEGVVQKLTDRIFIPKVDP
jgi:hypothetical protein